MLTDSTEYAKKKKTATKRRLSGFERKAYALIVYLPNYTRKYENGIQKMEEKSWYL